MPGKHRLAVKIEETVLGNGVWDKVTVKIPNPSYILTEVKHENNKLSILFEYSEETYQPMNFAFMLSAFGVNPADVAETDEFLVVGIDDGASEFQKTEAVQFSPSEINWFNSQDYQFKYIEIEGNLTDEMRSNEDYVKGPKCPPRCFD